MIVYTDGNNSFFVKTKSNIYFGILQLNDGNDLVINLAKQENVFIPSNFVEWSNRFTTVYKIIERQIINKERLEKIKSLFNS